MRAHRIINLYYYNEVNKDTKYENAHTVSTSFLKAKKGA